MYAWGYSTYRRTGTALGVTSLTAWRWVSAWRAALLPVAALLGVVRSSGVVGVDEKYVLVPKNAKPAGKTRRWTYVDLAADVWTYDLLHIAIYPNNDQDSAAAFLLALRAKGYHPQVIVTDLRQDHGPVIAQVFRRPHITNASSTCCSRRKSMSRLPTAPTMPSNTQRPPNPSSRSMTSLLRIPWLGDRTSRWP